MPISIDWATRVIHVPQSYLAVVSARDYSLDLEQFRRDLRTLEWSDTFGWASDPTHIRVPSFTISGTAYPPGVIITNGYAVEFQQTAQPYRVTVVGGNNNISDVQVINTVSLVTNNSAGLVQVDTGGGGGSAPTAAQNAAAVLGSEVDAGFSLARAIRIIAAAVAGKSSGGPEGFVARNLADTLDQLTGVADESGNRTSAEYGS